MSMSNIKPQKDIYSANRKQTKAQNPEYKNCKFLSLSQ